MCLLIVNFRGIVGSLYQLYVELNSMTSLVKTEMFKSVVIWVHRNYKFKILRSDFTVGDVANKHKSIVIISKRQKLQAQTMKVTVHNTVDYPSSSLCDMKIEV